MYSISLTNVGDFIVLRVRLFRTYSLLSDERMAEMIKSTKTMIAVGWADRDVGISHILNEGRQAYRRQEHALQTLLQYSSAVSLLQPYNTPR